MKRIFLHSFLLLFAFSSLFSNTTFEKSSTMFFGSIVTQDSFYVQTTDCLGEAHVCVDIPFDDVGSYTFTDNGTAYAGTISGCNDTIVSLYDYSTLFGQGMLGPYSLNDWDVNGTLFSGNFNNIPDLVDSMNLWDPTGMWVLDQAEQTISGGTSGVTYDDMDITVISIAAPSLIKYTGNTVPLHVDLTFTVGPHIVYVTNGIDTDTFYVEVVCVTTDTVVNTINMGQMETYCFGQSDFLGQISTVEILCSPNNGAVDFSLVAGNSCVEYLGVGIGIDTACFVLCDDFGICDTTHLYITSESNSNVEWINNTLFPNSSEIICIDTTDLDGNVAGISNGCPGQSGEYVMYMVDAGTFCVEAQSIDIGTDTACIYVLDHLGNIDTTYIVTTVVSPPVDTLMQSIIEGDSAIICVDTTQLSGPIASMENICQNSVTSGNIYTLDTINFCVNAQTTTMGNDTACIVLCDEYGTCDTTMLLLSIIPPIPNDPIVANDDSATTTKDETITVNVCGNDVIPGNSLTNYYILPVANGGSGPNIGFALFNDDCTITYTAEGSTCDEDDTFDYVICNADGCDTATVTITVLCEPEAEGDLMFYNGFSPNGDDNNDYYVIRGAENFPNSELKIFNRWGNQVYAAKNYQNDWNGSWEGVTVQDGTYFYLFNDGEGNTYSGFVVVRR